MWRPLLHFLWIGAALFAADRWLAPPPAQPPVVIPAARVAELEAAFAAAAGRVPTAAERAALVRAEVDDELLYRAARARGLDRDDPVIVRRLVQNMRFAGADPERDAVSLLEEALALGMDESDPVVRRRLVQRMRLSIEARALASPPDEETLRRHYEATRERHRLPARVRFEQRYFDGKPEGEAERALAALADRGADAPDDLGEPFLHGPRQPLQSEREVAARFGADFARAVLALPEGRWSGPVRSSYGVHLVRVDEREAPSQPPFDAVRDDVRHDWQAARRQEALADALASLREGTAVVVAGEPR